MRVPQVARLARLESLLGIARRWVGAGAVPFRATLFDKSGLRTWLVAWHQDAVLPLAARSESAEWGPWTMKQGVLHARAPAWALERVVALRIHLDDSGVDNGPLKVISGSHARGVLSPEEIRGLIREAAPETCLVRVGGVLAMRPLLVHASSKSTSRRPRRVIHIEYASSMDLAPGIRLALP